MHVRHTEARSLALEAVSSGRPPEGLVATTCLHFCTIHSREQTIQTLMWVLSCLYTPTASLVLNQPLQPTRASYSLPNAALQQVKESPYPASWADPALESLFVAKKTNSSDSPENSSSKPVSKKRGNTGTIAGAVVGGVVAVALVVGATLFFLRRRRKQLGILNTKKLGEQESSNIAEIQTFEPRTELDGHTPMVFELDGASGKK